MNEPDFSGIEPTRIVEAHRRIAIIEDYLDIERPSAEQTIAAARSLGLTRWPFARLVRVWRDHRNPVMLVKARTGPSERDYGIDDRGKLIAHEEIRRVGMGAEISSVAPAIEAACGTLGIKPPSRPTIYNYILAERRKGSLRFDRAPCFVIGRMWFHLPLLERARNAMPCALLGVALPERVVLAHSLSAIRTSPPSISRVLGDLLEGSTESSEPRQVLLDAADRSAVSSIFIQRGCHDIASSKLSPQRMLAQAFGDSLGPLRPVYRRGGALAKPKYVMGAHDQPLTNLAAMQAIEEAIDANNARRQKVAPYLIAQD